MHCLCGVEVGSTRGHYQFAVRLQPKRAARVHNRLCASCLALPLLQPRHA